MYRWVDVCLCQCENLVEEHEDEMIATFGQELPDYEHAICVELTGQPSSNVHRWKQSSQSSTKFFYFLYTNLKFGINVNAKLRP